MKETQQPDSDKAGQFLKQLSSRPHVPGSAPSDPMIAPEDDDFLGSPLSWSLSSSEDTDRQGVIGEYGDLLESAETSLFFPNEKGPIPTPTKGATVDTASTERMQTMKSSSASVPPKLTHEQTLKNQPAETNTASVLYPRESGENQPTFPGFQNQMTDTHLPFLLPGSLPSHTSDQNSTSSLPTGPGPDTLGWTTGISVTTKGNRDGFIDITDLILQRETASMEAKEGKSPLIIYSIPTLNLKLKLCPTVHFSFLA